MKNLLVPLTAVILLSQMPRAFGFSGNYQVENVASTLSLNVSNNLTSDGACVVQWTYSGANNELWTFGATSNGYYQITSVNSGKDVSVANAATTNGAPIVQWTFGTTGDDQWLPVQNGDGSYTFYNLNSGLVLEDPNSNTNKGIEMDQAAYTGANNQHWYLFENVSLAIDSLSGTITQNEIDSFKAYMAAQVPPPTPWGALNGTTHNAWADFSGGNNLEAMGLMYETTGDINILTNMIYWADTCVSERNDLMAATNGGQRICWDGIIDKIWVAQDLATTNPSTGCETGDAQGHMAYAALLILQNPSLWNQTVPDGDPYGYGTTYFQRATNYVQKCDEANNQYVLKYFVQPGTYLIVDPTNSAWKGLSTPNNRQSMFYVGFIRLAECHEILGDNPSLATEYDDIAQAASGQCINGMAGYHPTTVNGDAVYDWGYYPFDVYPNHLENVGHGAYDMYGVWRAYDRSVYGYTLSTVKPFANALVDVMNIATNSFSGAVDGTGTAQNYMQQQWLWLADLRSSAYDVVAQADYASGRYKSDPYMVAAILWMKNRRQQEFAVTPTPISQTIPVGGATNFTLVVAPLGGSTNAVSLTVTGLPSGATGAFNAPTVNLAALDYVSTNVTLSITTSASTPAGVYPLTITSANGSATHTNTLTLVLGNYALSVSPPSQAVSAGNGTSYTITVTTNAGFSGIVSFGLTGLPANTSAGFSPGSLNGAGGSILTVTTATNAASGDYTLTVNGTNGAEIASVTMNLAIVGATPVWNGGSASDNYWSDPANWSSNGLVPGTLLVFSGNARLNNTNDTAAGTAYSNIVFNSGAGAFTLNGNSILLAGNITNDSPALETVALPIDFTNNVTLDGDGGPLAITGGLTNTLGGAGSTTLTLAGTGTLDDSLGSAYNPGGTNTLSLNSASADWTIANNPSATPINTGPWVMQISAGTLNFGNGADAPNLDLNMAVSRQDNFVGSAGGLTGTLNIASGTLTTVSRWDTGGFNSGSDGIIAQSGGTFNVGSQLQGANVAGGASTITVSGGIMNIANGGGQFYVASRGTGTLTVSGSGQVACGILDVSRNASGNSAGSAGVVNLDGGILTCSRVGTATANAQTNTLNGTSATFNFNGGTLAAAASSTNFFQGSAVLPILPISAIVKGGGAVINDGGNAITVLDPLQHDSSLGGDLDGGLTKLGAGTLTLTGTNTYNGDTVIAAGTMALSGGGSIGGSDSITVSGGATLDASARADGTLTLAAGQTLTGSGAVNGNVVVGSGATLAPGGALNTLTFNNNLTLNGGSTTVFEASKSPTTNDFARAAGTVTLGGTIVITNISANAYAAGDSFQLFSAAGYAGMFTNIQPAIPGLNLAWNTNNLGAGTLSIVSSPTPQPQISAVTMRGGNFSFSATNGVPGWPCGVLASTNVALPLNQWTAIGTNHFDGSGNFTFTNAPDPAVPHTFYLLRLQ